MPGCTGSGRTRPAAQGLPAHQLHPACCNLLAATSLLQPACCNQLAAICLLQPACCNQLAATSLLQPAYPAPRAQVLPPRSATASSRGRATPGQRGHAGLHSAKVNEAEAGLIQAKRRSALGSTAADRQEVAAVEGRAGGGPRCGEAQTHAGFRVWVWGWGAFPVFAACGRPWPAVAAAA